MKDENRLSETRKMILSTVKDFVKKNVIPRAPIHDDSDTYPIDLIDEMATMGLFGINVPTEYGGLGLDYATYSMIFEELAKGWLSITGPIGTHSLLTYVIGKYGTEEQKNKWLPDLATGKKRGGLAMTEPSGGSDVASIQTHAVHNGDKYVVNGTKSFITNGKQGDVFFLLAKTNLKSDPAYNGITGFIAEKRQGLIVGGELKKLGYRGVDTAELSFQNYEISNDDVLGCSEGRGFYQAMDALEIGRINVAARAVGVASAAFEDSIQYAQKRHAFGQAIAKKQSIQNLLADMGTKVHAARLMTRHAADRKDLGGRFDVEAGMAKLFASEICREVTMDAMRVFGGYGFSKDLPLERYYRDAPLMIIGEGTNEIQRLVVARGLLKQYEI